MHAWVDHTVSVRLTGDKRFRVRHPDGRVIIVDTVVGHLRDNGRAHLVNVRGHWIKADGFPSANRTESRVSVASLPVSLATTFLGHFEQVI